MGGSGVGSKMWDCWVGEYKAYGLGWSVFIFRRFFGNYKQIFAEILSQKKILAELDGKITELGQDVKILAQLGIFCKVFA